MSTQTLISLDAPVRADELAVAMGISERSVMRRGVKGEFGERIGGRNVFYFANITDETVRSKIVSTRRAVTREIAAAALAETPFLKQYPQPLELFSESEQEEGREIRDFLLEVETMAIDKPFLTTARIIELITRREIENMRNHDREKFPVRFGRLLFGGRQNGCQLNEGNFYRWKARWAKWRTGVFDTSNWWCLCPRYRHQEYKRPGDGRFWGLFEAAYESAVGKDRKQAYEDTIKQCAEMGIKDLPSLHQVHYYYREHAEFAAVEAARLGRKHYYDKLTVPIIRNWRKIKPNKCWSSDHHMLNFFIRVPSPDIRQAEQGGFVKARPWLTDWLDVSSWFTVGWHISTNPSRDTIELAYRQAILAEGGAPKYTYCDNGKDYVALRNGSVVGFDQARMASINELLGVVGIYAIPHNPRAKLNERNYRVMIRFENRFFSFSGRNKTHMDALWDVKRGDGFTLRERLETFPKSHPMAGCLVRPELLPTLEEARAAFSKWIAEERHKMISRGRVCPGQSPEQRYRNSDASVCLTKVSAAEVGIAFLRVHPKLITIRSNGTIFWTPPGGKADDQIVYADKILRAYAGEKVQLRFDLNFTPPRLLAFERVVHNAADKYLAKPTWKQIVCEGPAGSVPCVTMVDAIAEDIDASQKLRDGMEQTRGLDRAVKKAADAIALREAEDFAARSIGLPPAARQYVLKNSPRPVAAEIQRRDENRSAVAEEAAALPSRMRSGAFMADIETEPQEVTP
jgi:hypothetical protein